MPPWPTPAQETRNDFASTGSLALVNGAAKIRWNTPGDHTRCVRLLSKYMPGQAAGYCQNLHKAATGVYTGDRRNAGRND